jgi:hypothetical protein
MYISLKDMRIRCQQPVGLLAPKEERKRCSCGLR